MSHHDRFFQGRLFRTLLWTESYATAWDPQTRDRGADDKRQKTENAQGSARQFLIMWEHKGMSFGIFLHFKLMPKPRKSPWLFLLVRASRCLVPKYCPVIPCNPETHPLGSILNPSSLKNKIVFFCSDYFNGFPMGLICCTITRVIF